MEVQFLDTNVIIRYLTQDNPEQATRAYHLLQQVEKGELTVVTTEGVIVEAVQVLSSKKTYHYPHQEIQKRLSPIILLKGLKLPRKAIYLEALQLYANRNIDFVDALIVALMRHDNIQTLRSFDHDFDAIPGIIRQGP